jgi:uncharacterized protein YjbI with pentapeptide repeats
MDEGSVAGPEAVPRPARFRRLSVRGLVGAVCAAAVAFAVARTTGAGQAAATGLALLLGAGAYMWAVDDSKSWGDLGQGILISVVVAIALMSVQHDSDERLRSLEERRAAESRAAEVRRQRAAERQSLQLTLTLQRDLSGTSLRGRDLSGFSLSGMRFVEAELDEADLTEANLWGSDLRRASAVETRFDAALLGTADLRGATLAVVRFPAGQTDGPAPFDPSDPSARPVTASFRDADLYEARMDGLELNHVPFGGADLTDANLQRAFLRGADLREARLAGADLRRARLTGATLCRADLVEADLRGAIYDDQTRWPPGFDADERGARRESEDPYRVIVSPAVESVLPHPPC